MKTALSIIVPIYKIEETLLRTCINSLLKQTVDNFEIILINDGSPDNTENICNQYAIEDNRIKVIHQTNQGVSAARNAGISIANGEWITFVDPDDWVEANLVESILKYSNDSNLNIIFYDYFQEFAHAQKIKKLNIESGLVNKEWIKQIKLAPFNNLIIDGKLYEYETNVIWNKAYRLSFIKNHNLQFDVQARKGEDVIFIAELLQYIDKIYYIKSPLYHYRYLQNSVTNRFNPNVMLYNEIAFKHYERIMKKFHLSSEYEDAYHTRILTRLYSSMRLYYFHKENPHTYKETVKEINALLDKYPYNKAIQKVQINNVPFQQQVFIYFLKKRMYYILKLMIKGRIFLKNLMGNRLK